MTLLEDGPDQYGEQYYQSGGYEGLNRGWTGQYFWARRFYADLVRRYCPPRARVLEVGCGLGDVLRRLQDDYSTCGIDVSAYAVEQARQVAPRSEVQELRVEQIEMFGTESFDGVLAVHVFEHLLEPERAARSVFDILRPGGTLIMATPNLDAPMRHRKGRTWFGYTDPTHISMKTPTEWLSILQSEGFAIRRVFGDGMWDVPYIPLIPAILQLAVFGLPAIVQTVAAIPFIPTRLSESLIVVADKPEGNA